MAELGDGLGRCVSRMQPAQTVPAVSSVPHLPGQVHKRRPLGPAHLKEPPLLIDASIEPLHLLLLKAHLEVALSQEGSLHSSRDSVMKLRTCCRARKACSVKGNLYRQPPLPEGAVAKCAAGWA